MGQLEKQNTNIPAQTVSKFRSPNQRFLHLGLEIITVSYKYYLK